MLPGFEPVREQPCYGIRFCSDVQLSKLAAHANFGGQGDGKDLLVAASFQHGLCLPGASMMALVTC